MPCYSPLPAFYGQKSPKTGKRQLVIMSKGLPLNYQLQAKKNLIEMSHAKRLLWLPCGQCIGCKLERSRDWAARCLMESKMHEKNSFITLTYDEEHLPKDGSVHVEHFQKFMKRLRKDINNKIRFLHCGEYGTLCKNCGKPKFVKYYPWRACDCGKFVPTIGRPHYHALIFGYDFPDRLILENKTELYKSEFLYDKWGMGNVAVGELTFESAAYVSRYTTEKLNGILGEKRYDGKTKEYITMSRGGRNEEGKNQRGIGYSFYEKYQKEIYPQDHIVVRGIETLPPKYFDKILESQHPDIYHSIKCNRNKKFDDTSPVEALFGGLRYVHKRAKEKEEHKKIEIKNIVRSGTYGQI